MLLKGINTDHTIGVLINEVYDGTDFTGYFGQLMEDPSWNEIPLEIRNFIKSLYGLGVRSISER